METQANGVHMLRPRFHAEWARRESRTRSSATTQPRRDETNGHPDPQVPQKDDGSHQHKMGRTMSEVGEGVWSVKPSANDEVWKRAKMLP